MSALDTVDLGVAAVSDAGVRRTANEDSLLAERPVFLVADGMGGYDAGDLASAAVVSAFRRELCAGEPADPAAVRRALRGAEDAVARVAAGTRRGAGSTVSGLVLTLSDGRPHWIIVNVGDSRVYRLAGSDLEQLTVDHSLVEESVAAGLIPDARRREATGRNVITRAIGAADSRADSWMMPVTTGERLLVCSDGLHGELEDERIRAILTMSGRPAEAAAELVAAAIRSGGRDNVSVVVVDVRAGGVEDTADRSEPSATATVPV